jgi:hypothetical protein
MTAAGWPQKSWKAEGSEKGPTSPTPKKETNKMKKLIAIAAVVVAGGVFAANYVYDFDATLKTTKGKYGSATINLGVDATGTNFWYNDTAVAPFTNDVKNVGGYSVPTIKTPLSAAAQAAIRSIATNYNFKSAGKWCATFKVEDCYRVTGTQKISLKGLATSNCCAGATIAITEPVTSSTIGFENTTATTIGLPLFQRFGSLDPTKANKVELYAQVRTFKVAGVEEFSGWLAGQGTMATRNNADYVSTVSGNIVGTLPAPKCENCCVLPTPAIAFDCATPQGGALPYTAGYGTFRLKINNKDSNF